MLVLLFALTACADPADDLAEREAAMTAAMAEHGEAAGAIRDALVDGALPKAKKAARKALKDLPLPGASPDPQQPLIAALKALGSAEDLDDAAEAAGQVAGACGSCHTQTQARPAWPLAEPPTATESVADQMKRHQWAAEAFWVGLITRDDARIAQASEVLSSAPLVPSGTPADSPFGELGTALEVRVHDLAALAARNPDPALQATRYGQMLATCATCHSLARD